MILKGDDPEDIELGDIIVFQSLRPDPIIHRVIYKWENSGEYYFQTKGDNNRVSIRNAELDETKISEKHIIGKALFRIPYLGYIKIGFVNLLDVFKR